MEFQKIVVSLQTRHSSLIPLLSFNLPYVFSCRQVLGIRIELSFLSTKQTKQEGKAKLDKVRKLAAIASKLQCSQAALALAWCASNTNVSTVLIGASKPEQVTQNLECLAVIARLTPDILAEIEVIMDNKPEAVATYGRL
jgi:aryl-alcohol dehydrogenase-like predicted oxidoreductase